MGSGDKKYSIACSLIPGEVDMDVTVSGELSFKKTLISLVLRAVKRLKMPSTITSIHIVTRYGKGDTIEVKTQGRAILYLRLDHFVRDKCALLPLKKLPANAFSIKKSRAVIYRLLVQVRDSLQFGIPEDQDEEFLCLWNTYVAGRISNLRVDLYSEDDYWSVFDRTFTGGRFVAEADMIFQALWTRDDLLIKDLYRFRDQLRQLYPTASKRR